MTKRTPPQGNKDAAREFCTPEILRFNVDQLRQDAQVFHDKGVSIEQIIMRIEKQKAQAAAEASSFEAEWEPDGKYGGAVTAWDDSGDRYMAHLKETSARFLKIASGLQWVADHQEEAQKVAVEKTKAVETSLLGADGGVGGHEQTKTAPAPAPTPPQAPAPQPAPAPKPAEQPTQYA